MEKWQTSVSLVVPVLLLHQLQIYLRYCKVNNEVPVHVTVSQLVATNHGDLVIVNLQRTPLDELASLRIYGKCDDVSRLLAEKLSLEIPNFHLHRCSRNDLHVMFACLLTTESLLCSLLQLKKVKE